MDMGRLKDQIKSDEGYRDSIYLDHLGNRTVGYGHLVNSKDWFRDEKVGFRLSQKDIDALLLDDLGSARRDCELLFNDFNDLPGEVKLICANMAFQLGVNRLGTFKKMIKAVNERDYQAASVEMLDSKWAKQQTPERAKRLADRMAAIDEQTA